MEDDVVLSGPLFAGLDRNEAAALLDSMHEVTLERGEVLFTEGAQGDRLYLIVRGTLKLGHSAADGRENLLAVLGPGELLGELAVFDPGPRTATATAVTGVTLRELGHDDLAAWITLHPSVALPLLGALAHRLRRTNETLADLVFSDVPGRVAKALLDLGKRFGTADEHGLRVAHGLTQEELAQLVGASRETVNKALADFTQRGWIRREGRTIILVDLARLERRAR